DFLTVEKREHFYAILLDSANHVMRKALIHIGTLTMSIVGPREIFREAVREGASSIIVAHNHPSGDPTPSPEDIESTKQLVQVGKLLDIPVLDHVIIGHEGYRSLSEMGLMGVATGNRSPPPCVIERKACIREEKQDCNAAALSSRPPPNVFA